VINGIASPEGEEVMFDTPVSTIENPRINEWLTEMEKQMRLTLAKNLAKAVQVR
jgi:dynein heavy chain 1